ncbi:response regulator transcription factor [Geomicrobium sediminis]|uniref:Two-component system response regulator ResD n=1 Tax=Geomicrobium sediminis TaxID=1347788 RepID=A0ABS2PFH7_9BACL|nr:response regulator transcription factor [Geomicrobium sediminis]EZH64192.1 transcriptional regulator [Bacillaceae bacterium JMAK1]MBM7634177.1 two-component system response regulator ResD [Geomicrobium sediminis]
MAERILIVDDERNMRELVRLYLKNEGYRLDEANSGLEAIEMIKNQSYETIILDIMLPDADGWEVCKYVRSIQADTSILMLTAKTDVEDRVKGLNIGADDYLVKPFAPEELVARVKALLRRKSYFSNDNQHVVMIEELRINRDLHEVKVAGKTIELTSKEFNILYLMANRTERIYTRENIIDQVWSMNERQDPRTIDTHIKNIRTKLNGAGLSFNPIKTVWGVGYKFNSTKEL